MSTEMAKAFPRESSLRLNEPFAVYHLRARNCFRVCVSGASMEFTLRKLSLSILWVWG